VKRLELVRARIAETGPASAQNAYDARFLSERIGGITNFVAAAKDLSGSHRNDYLDLSLSAPKPRSRLKGRIHQDYQRQQEGRLHRSWL